MAIDSISGASQALAQQALNTSRQRDTEDVQRDTQRQQATQAQAERARQAQEASQQSQQAEAQQAQQQRQRQQVEQAQQRDRVQENTPGGAGRIINTFA